MKRILILILILLISGCAQENEQEFVEEYIQEEFDVESEPIKDSCAGKQYTVSPVDVSFIDEITPLGNLNPPEHTIPTNHMYLHLNSFNVDLRAPADVEITSISYTEYIQTGNKDYSINFELCDGIEGYFIHIKTINPELEKLLDNCNKNVYGDGKYGHCWAGAKYKIKAGSIIGTVSNEEQGNFDFGTYDTRTKALSANSKRYQGDRSPLTIVCPLDLYDNETRNSLYEKVARNKEPICGQVIQDVPGTLQGNWYHDSTDDWDKQLAFAPDNHDPDKYVISIGGVFVDPQKWIFDPLTIGEFNRKFDQVKPGNVYCYEGEETYNKKPFGRVIIQLISDTELNIEYQSGSCAGSYSFNSPTTYKR